MVSMAHSNRFIIFIVCLLTITMAITVFLNLNINSVEGMLEYVKLPKLELIKLSGLKDETMVMQNKDFNKWELLLDDKDLRTIMETNKETEFNKKIRYELGTNDEYVKGCPIIINFTLENLSMEHVWVLTSYTPFEGIKGKIFQVTCDGKEIPYEGIMMKRDQPTINDYMHIDPKGSVSAKTDLSNAYALPTSKECKVEFKGRIFDFSLNGDSLPKKSEEHQMLRIMGNAVTFRVVNS